MLGLKVEGRKETKRTWMRQVEEGYIRVGLSMEGVCYLSRWIAGVNQIVTRIRLNPATLSCW